MGGEDGEAMQTGGGTATEDAAGSDTGSGSGGGSAEDAAGAEEVFQVPEGGFARGAPPDPCLIVIFGASGDLTRRSLLPSLFELHCESLLPDRFAVLGTARSEWDTERFRGLAREAVSGADCAWHPEAWEAFRERLFYRPADATADPDEDYAALGEEIERIRRARGIPDNVLFHLAVPPRFFDTIVGRLGKAGLARSSGGWRRLVIEKPFGEDVESARRLDARIRRVFDEDRIYRIDHFLGKETVQNMLVFRFANPNFEPIWNRDHIDHVQITVAEDIGIGTRAGFYEETGAVRDMVQNHLLQLLCLTALEPPLRFDAASLRDETVKVLEAVRATPSDPEADVVLGQYGEGTVDGERVPGYREEEGVREDSDTATFGALKLTLDNWRWADVPFYLRTGKRMSRKLTEVAIRFKPTPHVMFPDGEDRKGRQHVLAFRLQPEEGIVQEFVAKRPGPDISLQTVKMHFRYADAFGIEEPPRAYAWLLLDAMQGNQTLFARADWIYEAWKIVDPIVSHYRERPPETLPNYPAGSEGPGEARALLERDGRRWRPL